MDASFREARARGPRQLLHEGERGETWRLLFDGMRAAPAFIDTAWQRQPVHVSSLAAAPHIRTRFGRNDVRASVQNKGLSLQDLRVRCPAEEQKGGAAGPAEEWCTLHMVASPGTVAPECSCVYEWGGLTHEERSGGSAWLLVTGLLREGATVSYAGAQGWSEECSALVTQAQRTFGLPANANVFVSGAPSGAAAGGGAIHSEPHDIVAVQMQGSARWEIFAPTPPAPGVSPLARGAPPSATLPRDVAGSCWDCRRTELVSHEAAAVHAN